MKILLFCGHGLISTVGGAEKVFCNFANEFVRRGFEVGAVVNEISPTPTFAYPLDSSVRLFNLNGAGCIPTSLVFAKVWRETTKPLRKTFLAPFFPNFYKTLRSRAAKPKLDAVLNEFCPDVVVNFFIDDAKTLFFRRGAVDFASILTVHSLPSRSIPSPGRADRTALARCDLIQVLASQYADSVRRLTPTPVVVVPNVVPQFAERVDVDERERSGAPRIICAGRLDKNSKRQHLLIEAFAKIASTCPNWNLYFFGSADKSGRYRRRLARAIAQNRLEKRVFLCDSTPKIFEEELKSDILGFPSAYEGFPLALTEAQSLGLPAVGFRSAPSVNELIVDGENGFLADDVDDFAQKLLTLIESKELRARFGAAAKKGVERFEASRVWNRWEELIRETVEKKRRETASRREKNERAAG